MMTCCQCQRLLIILVTLLGMFACSQSPINTIKQSAGEVALIDRVNVKRQREFVIPPLSHIGLLIMPVSIDSQSDTQNSKLLTSITKEGSHSFQHVFSSVTLLDRLGGQGPTKIDFVIRASLLDAVSYIRDSNSNTDVISGEERVKPPEKIRKSVSLLSRVRPYRAFIKLELMDARSKQSLDVAFIKARSGALGSKQFSSLLRQSFAAYSKAITSTYLTVY